MFEKIIKKIFFRKHTVKIRIDDKTFIAFYRRMDNVEIYKDRLYVERSPKFFKKLLCKNFFIWDVSYFKLNKDGRMNYIRSEYLCSVIFPRTRIKEDFTNLARLYLRMPQLWLKSFNFEQKLIRRINMANEFNILSPTLTHYVDKVFEMLGVRPYEKFYISKSFNFKTHVSVSEYKYYLDKHLNIYFVNDGELGVSIYTISDILNNKIQIIPISKN